MLMGITLPCIFLVRIEQYLYYLRPSELLPTYGTAWVLLAALAVPIALAGMAALGFTRLRALQWSRSGVVALLLWAAAVAALSGLLLDGVVWLQTFDRAGKAGLGSSLGGALALLAMAIALPIALTRRGRRMMYQLAPIATLLTVLGGLAAVSIVVFPWDAGDARAASLKAAARSAPAGAPHMVLLTIDALSAQHMSLYGAERQTTPKLDAFAKQASLFERAYANSNFTTSSVSSILTGTRPWTHRAFQIFSWPNLETRRRSLPAQLERAGYTTGYIATNSYAGASRLGMGAYFEFAASDRVPMDLPCPDRIAAVLPYACPASQLLPLLLAEKLWFKLRASSPAMIANRHYDPGEAVDTALSWLRAVDKTRPVFVWLHLFPPHAPYAAPAPWLGRFDSSTEGRDIEDTDPVDNYSFRELTAQRVRLLDARYDEAVQYVDSYAGDFLTQALATLGDNTVVVVMADHGESFANGYGGHGGPGLYDSIIHVPLIVKMPHQTAAMRIAQPVEQIDIAPTLATLAGVAAPTSWEGRSLVPLWHEDSEATNDAPRPVFSMNLEENSGAALTTGAVAVVQGSWKLIHYFGPLHYEHLPRLQDDLYDLAQDPQETANRALDAVAVREQLSALTLAELKLHSKR
jgi:arylsulfatase A-like enzyme